MPATAATATIQALSLQQASGQSSNTSSIPIVPFYSQFRDITSAKWQKVGCGITDLAMIVDYYDSNAPSVDTLLKKGIAAGAYLNSAGWTYAGLIGVGEEYGLGGTSYNLSGMSNTAALREFASYVAEGPVIASVHYKFEPTNPIPHLVVITGITGDTIYYNDPAAKTGNLHISSKTFLGAWKKRFIVIRPVGTAYIATTPSSKPEPQAPSKPERVSTSSPLTIAKPRIAPVAVSVAPTTTASSSISAYHFSLFDSLTTWLRGIILAFKKSSARYFG